MKMSMSHYRASGPSVPILPRAPGSGGSLGLGELAGDKPPQRSLSPLSRITAPPQLPRRSQTVHFRL